MGEPDRDLDDANVKQLNVFLTVHHELTIH